MTRVNTVKYDKRRRKRQGPEPIGGLVDHGKQVQDQSECYRKSPEDLASRKTS